MPLTSPAKVHHQTSGPTADSTAFMVRLGTAGTCLMVPPGCRCTIASGTPVTSAMDGVNTAASPPEMIRSAPSAAATPTLPQFSAIVEKQPPQCQRRGHGALDHGAGLCLGDNPHISGGGHHTQTCLGHQRGGALLRDHQHLVADLLQVHAERHERTHVAMGSHGENGDFQCGLRRISAVGSSFSGC